MIGCQKLYHPSLESEFYLLSCPWQLGKISGFQQVNNKRKIAYNYLSLHYGLWKEKISTLGKFIVSLCKRRYCENQPAIPTVTSEKEDCNNYYNLVRYKDPLTLYYHTLQVGSFAQLTCYACKLYLRHRCCKKVYEK